jgi:hypothetical protein
LAHSLEAEGREDCIDGWFTNENNAGNQRYLLERQRRTVTVDADHNSHEKLTRDALRALNAVAVYGGGAKQILERWVAHIDDYKPASALDNLVREGFGELTAIISAEGGNETVLNLLHAYRGQPVDRIGMTDAGIVQARLRDGGVIRTLLNNAVECFNNGHRQNNLRLRQHALELLGISLHTIQDFYAHNVVLSDGRGDLRDLGRREVAFWSLNDINQWLDLRPPATAIDEARRRGGQKNVSQLEDDPVLDARRFENARHRTYEQLERFYRGLHNDEARRTLSGM